MNVHISRNFEERKKLEHELMEMELNEKEALDAIPEDVSCEEYDFLANEIYEKYDTTSLRLKIFALEYKEIKNDWFVNFVHSFGECKDKKLSYKQSNIFCKYLEHSHYNHYTVRNKYYGRVGNLFIEFERFQTCGYITIKNIDCK